MLIIIFLWTVWFWSQVSYCSMFGSVFNSEFGSNFFFSDVGSDLGSVFNCETCHDCVCVPGEPLPRRSSQWTGPVTSCPSSPCWVRARTGTWVSLPKISVQRSVDGCRSWSRTWSRGTPGPTAGSATRSVSVFLHRVSCMTLTALTPLCVCAGNLDQNRSLYWSSGEHTGECSDRICICNKRIKTQQHLEEMRQNKSDGQFFRDGFDVRMILPPTGALDKISGIYFY